MTAFSRFLKNESQRDSYRVQPNCGVDRHRDHHGSPEARHEPIGEILEHRGQRDLMGRPIGLQPQSSVGKNHRTPTEWQAS